MDAIKILLGLVAIYCGGMWLWLATYSFKTRTNVEIETFHLGLCLILALGFLGLMLGH